MVRKDVYVDIDVLHPASVAGLGRPLILVPGSAAGYTEYKSLDTLAADYGPSTPTYKLAKAIMDQDNKPNAICLATFVKGTQTVPAAETDTLAAVVDRYYDKSWHFALLAESDANDRLVLSNTVQPHDFKFAVVQVTSEAELAAFKENDRTIPLYHTNDGERLDGALIGEAASLEVGSIVWKFRHGLKGITPIDINDPKLDAIHDAGGNAYVMKAGVAQMSNGQVATGEFIDVLHGQDWVKATMESELQSMLTFNNKIPPNANGVSLVSGVMTSVLTQAGSQGIVERAENGQYAFNVYTAPYEEGTAEDQKNRVYSGATFDYKRQGAIHKINVKGSVVSA